MSLREAVARVLSSDPASNYLGTAATVLDLVCLDVNCLYSVGSTYNDLLENLRDSYDNPEIYNPKKFVLNPEIKKVRREDTCSPYIRDRNNMLLAYIGSKKVNSAEIVRSMVLLAQLIKVPDRDELILDALRLLAKQDNEGIRLLGMKLHESFVAVNEKEREELSKVLNTMGTIDLSTINSLL